MKNSTTTEQNTSNFDTSSSKIVDIDASCGVKVAQNYKKSTDIDANLQHTDEVSAISLAKEDENINSSIYYTNNFTKAEQTPKGQNSDTSKIILDPLSEIDIQLDVENKSKSTLCEDENLVFSKLFPNISLEKLQQDKLFCLFSSHNGKNLTISDLYTNYLHLISALGDDFAKKSLFSMQNKLVSPGSLASSETPSEIFFTKEQVLKMSPEQISKNYDFIRKSQQKWYLKLLFIAICAKFKLCAETSQKASPLGVHLLICG